MFLGQPECFHIILSPQTGLLIDISKVNFTLCISVYYFIYPYFNYLTLFSTSRYSNLRSLIFYSVCLTRYFILTPFTFFFRLGAFLHCYRVWLLHFVVNIFDLVSVVVYCYLVNPLDRILQNLHVYYVFDYLIWRFLWCIYLLWGYQILCMILAIPKRLSVLWFYRLCFLIGV